MRHPDWFWRLCEEVLSRAALRFRWGTHDCCTFAAACIDAMTGSRQLPLLRDQYHSEASAREFMRMHGGLAETITLFLGEQARASRTGDCVVFEQGRELKCGIVFGPFIMSADELGVGFCLRRKIRARWSV